MAKCYVNFAGEDLAKVREVMEREGYASISLTVRVLALAAIETTYPKLKITREERAAEIRTQRQKVLSKVATTFDEVLAELRGEIGEGQDAQAMSEKEQVTFSREDQE